MTEDKSILDKVISSKQISDRQQFNPSEVVSTLLKNLSSKEEDIIRRRFGLHEKAGETLDKIGKLYHVTRERIRQIENGAIQKIKQLKNFRELVSSTEKLVDSILTQHRRIMSEKSLLEELFTVSSNTSLNKNCLIFILSELLTDKFEKILPSEEFRSSWKLKSASLDFLRQTIDKLIELIKLKNRPLKASELIEMFKQDKLYQEKQEKLSDQSIIAYLEVSQKIAQNPFEEYGLVEWGSIVPKRMNDKIYLIFKKQKRPLHYTEITKLINEAHFDKRVAHPPTVHNELILNDRYVLVGRGIYALKEWGYKPGVVVDVLVDILKKEGQPLSREELVKKVLERRIVKKNTIHLALTDKNKFKRLDNGLYDFNSPFKS